MTKTSETLSYHVIELVRQKISTQWLKASDTEIAKALGLSRAAVSAYRNGVGVMSIETLARAQEILDLPGPELAALSIELSKEGTKDPRARKVFDAVLEMVRGHAAIILIAFSGVLGGLFSQPAQAFSPSSSGDVSTVQFMYYAN